MKVDFTTKLLLMLIVIFLGILTVNQIFGAGLSNAGSSGFEYIKPIGYESPFAIFLDTRNGDIWHYDLREGKVLYHYGSIAELGKPLVKSQKK